jgi:hypothetical protein
MRTKFWFETLEGRVHSIDVGINDMIILEGILEKLDEKL